VRAEILVPLGARRFTAPVSLTTSLYTYTVPDDLIALVAPGQLVAVPFGERTVAGIVWEMDASEDVDPSVGEAGRSRLRPHKDTARQAGEEEAPLRPIGGILLDEPVLLPLQRALAEWVAEYYAAPLVSAVRLMLPPGLLRSVRYVVRPSRSGTQCAVDAPECGNAGGAQAASSMGKTDSPTELPRDEAIVLALLRDRGELDRDTVLQALGTARGRATLRALVAAGRITLGAALPPMYTRTRHERWARLAGSAAGIAAWRATARNQLAALPPPATRARGVLPRSGSQTGERQAERLLRQLAVLDVLARPGGPSPSAWRARQSDASEELGGGQQWRVEELRRLTRITPSALAELEAAGLIAVAEVAARHDPLAGRAPAPTQPLALSHPQANALRVILETRAEPGGVYLLHGITGSGKTEIYLQALAATLTAGRRGIVLVPEIALTPQAVERFAGRFPGRVALLHSGLSAAERLDEWRRIRAGAVDIVVGSRSALFAPVARLGLIVVDEEHEAAYKEERTPSYHARDVAVRLGQLAGARVVLGSATPSVESYWRAQRGEYTLIELRERAPVAASERYGAAGLPQGLPPVTLVDLRAELRAGNTSILSAALHTALGETLARGEQAILFLNRRGMASSVTCRECGYVVRCVRCDVSLTYHASERVLLCHYCGRREPAPSSCPVCWSASIRYFGLGTERIEATVKRQFPAARVLRWDRDTARTRQAHEELLRAFAERQADVLVGTQMIAKGLDLPGVTLVGVVSADIALFLPDFRASERAFQLLTQVAGRAGRGEAPGRVLVQTFNPEHFCIQAAAQHDYVSFVAAELAARVRYGYPPLRRFVKWTYEHRDRHTAQIEALVLAERLERLIAAQPLPEADVVGPAPALLERLRGRYRWQVLVRAPDPLPLLRALSAEDVPPGWSLDLDPLTTA
jgi:primosomal protein N' (replication factor Y)